MIKLGRVDREREWAVLWRRTGIVVVGDNLEDNEEVKFATRLLVLRLTRFLASGVKCLQVLARDLPLNPPYILSLSSFPLYL